MLGVDPSLSKTGMARVVDGVVAVRRLPTPPTRLGLLGTRHRIRAIVTAVVDFAPERCLTVIEAPALSRGGQGQFVERCGLYWMLVDQLCARGPVVAVTPRGRAKYATGNGNAAKPAVVAAVRASFPGVAIPDDNVADALALAAMGARYLGSPIDGDLTVQHLAAMSAPDWPSRTAVAS